MKANIRLVSNDLNIERIVQLSDYLLMYPCSKVLANELMCS